MKFSRLFRLSLCILWMTAVMPIQILQLEAADVDVSKIVWFDKEYDSYERFSDEFIKVGIGKMFEEKWGLIDKNGKEVIAPKYESLYKQDGDLIQVRVGAEEGGPQCGYINTSGDVVIPLKYFSAKSFQEGLAAVAIREGEEVKWGFIDESGKTVIPFKYSYAGYFENGLANVAFGNGKDRKWLFIDKK